MYGESGMPVRVRLTIALMLTAILLPLHRSAYTIDLTALPPVLMMLFQEIIIGAVLGLTARLAISALQVAGSVVAPGWPVPRTGRVTGQQFLEVRRMVVRGEDVEHGHRQQLRPRPAVLADGRIVHRQDPQRVDVVDPHGQRVQVEQQR